jgi:putative addiction module component (TIGR02574 family)
MASDLSTQQIIDTVLRLPLIDRERVFHALQENLAEEEIDHGPEEPEEEVEAAWGEEIARRIADIDSGRVKTIPAEEAERMIRGDAEPRF